MEISTFNNEEFGEIRTIQENGEVLFCGADIAKALGYSNTRDALSRHCKGVVKCDTPTNGGVQTLGFISEGDVYRLIAHSKLPGAERFERYVIWRHLFYCVNQQAAFTQKLIWAVAAFWLSCSAYS